MADRVLVIGLDGATFDLIKPWAAEGRLPNLARLMNEGAHGPLTSTTFPVSAPAWTSFMTGKNPGKHGIFGFTERMMDSYAIQYTNSRSRSGKAIWDICTDHGLPVGVIDVPMTYPPSRVDGFMIAGMDSLWEESKFTYPPELMAELEAAGGYVWYPQKPEVARLADYIRRLHEVIDNRTQLSVRLMRSRDWRLFVTVQLAPDRAQHTLWRHMDPNHVQHEPELGRLYGGAIRDVYEHLDRCLGELVAAAGEQTSVIVMSDHGHGPYRRVINLSKWLEQNGYLAFGAGAGRLKQRVIKEGWFLLQRLLPERAKRRIKTSLPGLRRRWASHLLFSQVDWSGTRAYAIVRNIFVNLKGREPQGVVEPGAEYEDLLDEIIERLGELRDPETGQRVLGRAFKKSEIYHGERELLAPDLVIFWKDFAYYTRDTLIAEQVNLFDPPGRFGNRHIEHSACHRLEGIFMATGPGVARGVRLGRAEIIDLAPTVLYLLGLPVPTDMDGRVLTEALDPRLLADRPVTYREVAAAEGEGGSGGPTFSEEEAKVVGQRLRDLGYVD